jgi:hypothetical protein
MVAAEVETSDASDGGHENDREEGADVEDEELFPQAPGKREKQECRDAEEDVAADFRAGSFLVRAESFACGDGQLGSPWIPLRGCFEC